jgi:hypothetical protein
VAEESPGSELNSQRFERVDEDGPLRVNHTGRLFRKGKVFLSREVSALSDRLGSRAESWRGRRLKLKDGRWLGRVFAATRGRRRGVASARGVLH